MALVSLCLLAAVAIVVLVTKYLESSRKETAAAATSKLPGPKGLPFIGNVHELPAKCSWMKFHEWGEQYGPIYQVDLAGTNHVWISRDKIAHDLLSKRSGIYSDRPFIPALEHDNRTSGQYLPLMSKNDVWSRQRRFAKQIMDKSEKESFYRYPELEAIRLLFELMSEPSQYNTAMESFVARVTSRLAWGTAAPAGELKQRARELLIGVSPTGSFANKLPAVMSMPETLSSTKAWELRRGRTERKFFETMQDEVRQALSREPRPSESPYPRVQAKQSWTQMFLESKSVWGFTSDLEGAYAVGMHGIAGALTIAAPMQSFCLAMCHFPQHQKVLHEEIDRVLGDRMPTFDDMPKMPVLRAFIRETLRWRPPVPTGIPHALTQDDVYEGYHIPKGSVIHPLEWSISRDPDVFINPDEWNPMRWLESKYPTYQEPLTKYPTITQYSQFGYGRRTCQGMGVTEADLFVGLGSIAWLFSMHAEEKEEALQPQAEDQRGPVSPEPVPETVREPSTETSSEPSTTSSASRRSSFSSSVSGSQPATPENESSQTSLHESTADLSRRDALNKLGMHSNDSAISMPRSDSRKQFTFQANDSGISMTQSDMSGKPSMYRNDSGISVTSLRSFTAHYAGSIPSTPGEFPSSGRESPRFEFPPIMETVMAEDAEAEHVASLSNRHDLQPSPPQSPSQPDANPPVEDFDIPSFPGSWDSPVQTTPAPLIQAPSKSAASALPDYEHDPTLNFSTLLIAKPLPFKFRLKIRSQYRAEKTARAWIEKKFEGEFVESRVYWKNENKGDAEIGWGETFL